MTQGNQIQQDLRFVRHLVDRRGGSLERTPLAIPWIWGIFVLVSFTLLDFNLRAAMWMFAVVAPACGILSGWIGYRTARRYGDIDRRAGLTHAMHWGTIFLAMIALSFLVAAERISGAGIGQVATLIVGVVYFLAGVHFDRRWMISGLLLMIGAVVITWIGRWPWTSLGVAVCLALIVPTFIRTRGS